MPTQTKLAPNEVAARGEVWYEKIKAQVEPSDFGRYLVLNVETGEYEVGSDFILPTERLLARNPDAELYALRIGYRAIGRIGSGHINTGVGINSYAVGRSA